MNEVKKMMSTRSWDWGTLVRKYGILLVLLGLCLFLFIYTPVFRTGSNAISVLLQVSINGILALGMTFVITAGGIDLSIGSFIALTSVTCGAVLHHRGGEPGNVILAIVLSIAACALFGLFNGFFVAHFNMFPFVVTLASQMIIRGIAYVVADGQSFIVQSPTFRFIGGGKLFGVIPFPIIIFFVVAAALWVLLHHTKFGRYIYAVGGNIKAATAAGIAVSTTRIMSFVIMGVCSAIAGVVLSSRVMGGQPNLGLSYETDAIAACVIGGTSLTGGVGTIPGTIIGILIIGVINNGMNLMQISSYYQTIVKGAIIIGAVLLDMAVTRKNQK